MRPPPPEQYLGYNTAAPDEILELYPDYILCSAKDYDTLIKNLKKTYPKLKKHIIPFVEVPFKYRWYGFLCEHLPDCRYKRIIDMKRMGNEFYIINKNGRKIHYPDIKGLKVVFNGYCAKIIIHDYPMIKLSNTKITCGDGATTEIKSSKHYLNNTSIYSNLGKNCFIDENFSMAGGKIYLYYKCNITIGKDCMFSYNVRLRTSDSHTIYDNDTKELLNENKDIKIDNHVWLGCGTTVLKGAYIAPNRVVGAKSLVTKEFRTPNCVIAGHPARIIKENINWERTSPHEYVIKQ